MRYTGRRSAALLAAFLVACGGGSSQRAQTTTPEAQAAPSYAGLPRLRFNQMAMQLNLPLFWVADVDEDGAVDPDEVRALLFYPSHPEWVADGHFTDDFGQAYQAIMAAADAPAPADERERLVLEELRTVAPTLVDTDLREMPEAHRAFAAHMLRVAELVDRLYARQVGMDALAPRAAEEDVPSQSLFRRNWGPECHGSGAEPNPACSAIEGAPKQPVDVYPAAMQAEDGFCHTLEESPNASALLTPFSVVREREGELVAVPYGEAYAEQMQPIAEELRAAADAMTDPEEAPLVRYLRAAAQSFLDNDWEPANEAWASMNARNSHWYVRVGPDEVYWEPCSHKAGFHMTFALIDRSSLAWQDRLTPLQQRMEQSFADLVDGYEARDVSFHMPDFIGIVVNAGDDRDAFGATIGQSLPNWGPVAEEGRGRTVAMSNLYTDPDSQAKRREEAASLLSPETMAVLADDPQASLVATILHEATHNLGPAHEYRVNGQTAAEAFGGGMASMLEELKAQTGALYYLSMLGDAGVLDENARRQVYLDCVVWAFGHISRGMYTPSGQRKAYSQLAAVQIGYLMDHDVVRWDPEAVAANGTDHGAFTIDFDAFPAAAHDLMELVGGIKARNDRARAEELAARYVDGDVVPQQVIAERFERFPRTSFVYAVER